MSAPLVSQIPRFWKGKLAHYGLHRNDEHCAALFDEAIRYTGFHLEADLSDSAYWSSVPLYQRAIVLLFLVDRGLVSRATRRGRRVFEPLAHAEAWVESQPTLHPYLKPTLELLAALRRELLEARPLEVELIEPSIRRPRDRIGPRRSSRPVAFTCSSLHRRAFRTPPEYPRRLNNGGRPVERGGARVRLESVCIPRARADASGPGDP